MARLTRMILVYFVVGAVMFGGGAIAYEDAGIANYFVDQGPTGDAQPTGQAQEQLNGIGGALTSIVGQFGGTAIIVWNLAVGMFSYLNWPWFVLSSNGAPFRVTLLLGGSLVVMFWTGVIILVRQSA